ncbi:serine hydrolase domain-containing protein [Thalassobacillus pellis]|uniref:serine hydrolase domain-containing protein n=1 Tax=Thalassobacillus pellis TaxID=748008 RepID=UPI001EF7B71F|nr:serine hydrolase domain-containing protein [Thalassobacillus pellis]MBM7554281.1 CubicO group peptidase (beta-lactamase class C family) [Thalassobacillus pellis]
MLHEQDLKERIENIVDEKKLSGTVILKQNDDWCLEITRGFANRSERISNNSHTRFGIASGCKLFTAIAICQLVEQGMISPDLHLEDCLDIEFPYFNKSVTIDHLLTHRSGIPDYFDEEVMEDFADLWKHKPMYTMDNHHSFLPFFQYEKMKFPPGERFHYNNAGYILLGLIVEAVTGTSFTNYVEHHIFERTGMKDSGYYALDQLPENTAIGYIDKEDGTWVTNIYSIPIKGGADGGAIISAPDMIKLWEAISDRLLLSEDMTRKLIHPYVHVNKEMYYGYGVWVIRKEKSVYKYQVMGYDPGVRFHSSYYPESNVKLVITANNEADTLDIMKRIEILMDK